MPDTTIFDDLITEINQGRGNVTFTADCAGRAIHSRGRGQTRDSRGRGQTRDYRFTIYNHASWGTRTVRKPPGRLGSTLRSVTVDTSAHPDLRILFPTQISLSPERPTVRATHLVTIRDTAGRAIIQINSCSMYLLFDIQKAARSVEVLRQLYEHFVAPLSEDPCRNPMRCFSENLGSAPSVATTPAVNPSTTPEAPGRGTNWSVSKPRNVALQVPEESRPDDVVGIMATTRRKTLSERVTRVNREVTTRTQRYDQLLVELRTARSQMFESQDEATALQRFQDNPEEVVEDSQTEALRAVLDSFYEKIWVVGEKIYGLTRPVVCSYREPDFAVDVDDTEHFQAVIGKFVVVVDLSGSVDYYREDHRVARRNGSGKFLSPHNSDGSICWGTAYRDQMTRCQESGDLAQLFLLTYNHLTSCTGADCYMQLRIYAEHLGLPHTDSAEIDLNDPETREKFLENADEVMAEARRHAEEVLQRAEEARLEREAEERRRLEEEARRQQAAEEAREAEARQEAELRMQRVAQITSSETISLEELSNLSGMSVSQLTENGVSNPEAPVNPELIESETEIQQ